MDQIYNNICFNGLRYTFDFRCVKISEKAAHGDRQSQGEITDESSFPHIRMQSKPI